PHLSRHCEFRGAARGDSRATTPARAVAAGLLPAAGGRALRPRHDPSSRGETSMSKCLRPSITAAVLAALLPCALLASRAAPAADSADDKAANTLAHDIFKQLIEINTTDSVGNVTTAAAAMAQRFREAGYSDVFVGGPNERKKNVVIRLRGSGKHKPVLLIGHLDVVEAKREDWTTDPFKFIEKDGYFYGRGSSDMKDGDAIMATTMIRLKKEGFRPDRDIILALTADEEGGCCNGPAWLIKNHRDLVAAEFVLNHDGSSLKSEHGKPMVFQLGATEKVYADYRLGTTNKGGHSSQPRPDNAIYELAQGLLRVGAYQFPFELNNVTRAYFERMAAGGGDHPAHDLRRHASGGRPCQQRAAAARHRQRDLPHPARALQGGGAPGPHQGAGRSEDHGALRRRRRHHHHRHRPRPARLPAPAHAAGGAEAARGAGGRHVARRQGHPVHGRRGLGRHLHQRRRHADLRRLGGGDRPRRRACPRP